MGTYIVGGIVLIIAAAAARHVIKTRKSCGCEGCAMSNSCGKKH